MIDAAFAAAGLLLAIGGLTKMAWPSPAADALAATGLPSSNTLARAMGGAELVLGIAAVFTGARPLAALVGAAYLAFAAFVVAAMGRGVGEVRSCGCFGAEDTPPGPVHVVVDVILAAVALVAAAVGVDGLPDALSFPYVVATAVLTYAGYAALTSVLAPLSRGIPRHGGARTEVEVGRGDTVYVFLTTTCLTCREIWPRLAPLGDAQVIAVTKGPEDENAERVHALAPKGIEVMMSTELWDRYGVTVAPAVVVVDGEGAITSASAIRSWEEVSSSSRP